MSDSIEIVEADLSHFDHQQAVLKMIETYSSDPMGDGKPLDADVRANLIPALRKHPTTLIFLAFDGGCAVAAAICFLGLSAFTAKPLVNIHDCIVAPTHRGRGLGRKLIAAVERKARELGCCKLTLEVMDKNQKALSTYRNAGFAQYVLQEAAGRAIFMSKALA